MAGQGEVSERGMRTSQSKCTSAADAKATRGQHRLREQKLCMGEEGED